MVNVLRVLHVVYLPFDSLKIPLASVKSNILTAPQNLVCHRRVNEIEVNIVQLEIRERTAKTLMDISRLVKATIELQIMYVLQASLKVRHLLKCRLFLHTYKFIYYYF